MGQCNGAKTKEEQMRYEESLAKIFPDFQPMKPDAPQWQKECSETCLGCSAPYDFLSIHAHCRSCGRIFCHRCCYKREAIRNQKICGRCMGGAMSCLRRRELSSLDQKIQKHSSQLQARRGNSNCSSSMASNSSGLVRRGDSEGDGVRPAPPAPSHIVVVDDGVRGDHPLNDPASV